VAEGLPPEWERVEERLAQILRAGGWKWPRSLARRMVAEAVREGVDPHEVDLSLITPENALEDWRRHVLGAAARERDYELEAALAGIESEISYIDYLLSRIERRPDAPYNEGLQVAYRHLKRLRAEKERQRDELVRRLARGRRR